MDSSRQKVERLLKRGTIVTERGEAEAAIGILDGKIAGIYAPDLEVDAEEVLDVPGCHILPGVVDAHVHFWEPGPYSYREDFLHGTRAAAAGGVTTVIEMPLSVPPVKDKSAFELKRKVAGENSVVDFALWGALMPASVENLKELWDLGCVAFKAFMSYANEEYPHTPDGYLLEAMRRAAGFNGLIGVHAENAEIVDHAGKELRRKGVTAPEAHADSRPEIAEIEAIQRAALFAAHARCRVHIVHMSLAEGARAIRSAKQSGIPITVETCPHYLAADRSLLSKIGAFAKCNPPLRTKENVQAMWHSIFDGTIDTIGSDHSPYSDEEKMQGGGNIWEEPPGFSGLETMLPVLLDEGYHRRGLGLREVVRLTSENVARLFGLYPRKGSLSVGAEADLAVVDLRKEWTYTGTLSLSKTRSANGPFEGRRFRGKIVATLVRGNPVYRDGEITADPGSGRYVPRIA